MKLEYKTAWIEASRIAEHISIITDEGWVFVCFTPHHRTSGEGTKGTFLREYLALFRREKV